MTDNQPENQNEDDLKTFDMYHFFSRTDVLLAIIAVVGLLLLVLFFGFSGEPVV